MISAPSAVRAAATDCVLQAICRLLQPFHMRRAAGDSHLVRTAIPPLMGAVNLATVAAPTDLFRFLHADPPDTKGPQVRSRAVALACAAHRHSPCSGLNRAAEATRGS